MEANLKIITKVHPKKPMKIVTGIGYTNEDGEIPELVTICTFPLPNNLTEAEEQFKYARLFVASPKMYSLLSALNETIEAGIAIKSGDTIHRNIQSLLKQVTE